MIFGELSDFMFFFLFLWIGFAHAFYICAPHYGPASSDTDWHAEYYMAYYRSDSVSHGLAEDDDAILLYARFWSFMWPFWSIFGFFDPVGLANVCGR